MKASDIANQIYGKFTTLGGSEQKALVGAFFTSCATLHDTWETLRANFPSLRIKIVHGRATVDANGVSHEEEKAEFFGDINNKLNDVDVLLYTSTMTIGISYDVERPIHQFMVLETKQQMPSCVAMY